MRMMRWLGKRVEKLGKGAGTKAFNAIQTEQLENIVRSSAEETRGEVRQTGAVLQAAQGEILAGQDDGRRQLSEVGAEVIASRAEQQRIADEQANRDFEMKERLIKVTGSTRARPSLDS